MDIKKILIDKLINSNNESLIINEIFKYLGNECQKCHLLSNKKLINVISFNDGVRDYNFRDIKGTKYGLKKFCEKCIFSKASQCKIYVEIN